MSIDVASIRKTFGGETALDGVDLRVEAGEIHALLGPNGSGKSTLIRCLSGAIAPDSGTIAVGGVTHRGFTPRSAIAAGTAVIYQHFSLVPALSVADNVFLGSELRRAGRIDRAAQREQAAQLLQRLGREIDPRTPVAALSVGEQQLVEIAKALRHRPRLLILDEPTAALGEREARILGQQVRRLRDEGLAILYVTHLLNEVFEIADRVTILRDGRVVLHGSVAEVTRPALIEAISPALEGVARERNAPSEVASRPPLLQLDRFCSAGVGPVDLDLRAGEIVGVFGLLGSGRTELLEGIYGIRGDRDGEARLGGRPFVPRSPVDALRRGVALVAAERGRQSMLARMAALDNMLLPHFSALAGRLLRDRGREQEAFAATARLLGLRPPNPNAAAWSFSGGNQQKLAVGRWLTPESRVDVLLLDDPTQGIDVGARQDLYALLRRLARERGLAVLFTSSDPEEIEALADRVIVLNRRRVVGELEHAAVSSAALLDLAHADTVPAA